MLFIRSSNVLLLNKYPLTLSFPYAVVRITYILEYQPQDSFHCKNGQTCCIYIELFCQHLLHLLHQIVISLRSTNAQIIQHVSFRLNVFSEARFIFILVYWKIFGHLLSLLTDVGISSHSYPDLLLFSHETNIVLFDHVCFTQ